MPAARQYRPPQYASASQPYLLQPDVQPDAPSYNLSYNESEAEYAYYMPSTPVESKPLPSTAYYNDNLASLPPPPPHRMQPQMLDVCAESSNLQSGPMSAGPSVSRPHQGALRAAKSSPAELITGTKSRPKDGSRRKQPIQRQQFTACEACGIRRVKCDRKELLANHEPGKPDPPCTECYMRGMPCVPNPKDKRLRTGKRLEELQRYYPKVDYSSGSRTEMHSLSPKSPTAISIPPLQSAFFESAFCRRFHVQWPILDLYEFKERFMDARNSNQDVLGLAGGLIPQVLVIWAISYGVDSSGAEHTSSLGERHERRARCDKMCSEVLRAIDARSVLRQPSWDSVRLLLLFLPLTQGILKEHERKSIYGIALLQLYELCMHDSSLYDTRVRTEPEQQAKFTLWWYAFTHEGITCGLRGDRLVLDAEECAHMLPEAASEDAGGSNSNLSPIAPSASVYPPFSSSSSSSGESERSHAQTARPVRRADAAQVLHQTTTHRYALASLRISRACRAIHSALKSRRAEKSYVDEGAVREAWGMLDGCWEELEGLRGYAEECVGRAAAGKGKAADAAGLVESEENERFVLSRVILLLGCHNVIKDELTTRLSRTRYSTGSNQSGDVSPVALDSHRPRLAIPLENLSGEMYKLDNLESIAKGKCVDMAQRAATLLPSILGRNYFQYDASLVWDGAWCTGQALASLPGAEHHVEACISALGETRWVYADTVDHEDALTSLSMQQEALNPSMNDQLEHLVSMPTSSMGESASWDEATNSYGDIKPFYHSNYSYDQMQSSSSRGNQLSSASTDHSTIALIDGLSSSLPWQPDALSPLVDISPPMPDNSLQHKVSSLRDTYKGAWMLPDDALSRLYSNSYSPSDTTHTTSTTSTSATGSPPFSFPPPSPIVDVSINGPHYGYPSAWTSSPHELSKHSSVPVPPQVSRSAAAHSYPAGPGRDGGFIPSVDNFPSIHSSFPGTSFLSGSNGMSHGVSHPPYSSDSVFAYT